MKSLKLDSIKRNSLELFTGAMLFVGFPVSAALYFDYRAGLLTLSLIGSAVGLLAIRSK